MSAQYPGSRSRPRADLVRSLEAKGGLAAAKVRRGEPRCGGRQRGGGRAGTGRTFRAGRLGRRGTIADVRLEARPQFDVTDLVVTRMGDQYIVLAHDERTVDNVNEGPIGQPQGMLSCPVRRARLYALDLQGRLAWPAPVDVDHQQFLLSQPGRLPVLLFSVVRFQNVGGQFSMQTSLVAVDRRNGRIVCDKDLNGPFRGWAWERKSTATRRKRPCG